MTLSAAVQNAMLGTPEQTEPDVRKAAFFFPETFAGFDGHFPGNPMLPGIAQIMSAALTAHPDGPSRICQVRRTKFVSMVRPGDTMTVEARMRDVAEGVLVTAECSTDNGVCAAIKLVLAPA